MNDDCSADHRYTWAFTPDRSGPVVVSIEDDVTYDDNYGRLSVTITRDAPA
jgi:hypothetical protein